jgi:hypothetical protein
MKEKNAFSDLFESRPKNKKNKWSDELDRFRVEERLDMSQDPLLWWKINEIKYPLLGTSIISRLYHVFTYFHFLGALARKYLAIPASQASCERLFSIARQDITEKRTSMLPDLVEALIFIARRKDIKDMI